MNWYQEKCASFIDSIHCEVWGDSQLKLWVGNKSYVYSGINGNSICGRLEVLKKLKNKRKSGQEISKLLKTIEPNLVVNEDEESVDSLMKRSEPVKE